jgi:hypothetical protein
MEQAQTLEAAVQNLDHLSPLTEETGLGEFFVAGGEVDKIIDRLTKQLETQYPARLLFTGHKGSGKTSLVNKLVHDLNERGRLWVVKVSAEQELDVNDLNYLDILFLIAVGMLRKSQKERLRLGSKIAKRLDAWAASLEPSIEERQKPSLLRKAAELLGDVGDTLPEELSWLGKALGFVLALGDRIGQEKVTRDNLRDHLEPGLSELEAIIEDLAKAIQEATHRRVVCFIDGADRATREKQKELFLINGQNLIKPKISLVYTIDLFLRYENDFRQIEQLFKDFGLPCLKYWEGQSAAIMEAMLDQRLHPDLITGDAKKMLIHYSGGVVRSLIQLANEACINALVENHNRIEVEDVRESMLDERRQYQRILTGQQYELLNQVHQDHGIDKNKEAYLELLRNLSILEYANGDTWWDVNPIVLDILEARAKAKKKD